MQCQSGTRTCNRLSHACARGTSCRFWRFRDLLLLRGGVRAGAFLRSSGDGSAERATVSGPARVVKLAATVALRAIVLRGVRVRIPPRASPVATALRQRGDYGGKSTFDRN